MISLNGNSTRNYELRSSIALRPNTGGRLHRVVSPDFALNRTGRSGRRQNPIRADHLRRATCVSMFGLLDCCWTSGAGAMAGSTVRALRGWRRRARARRSRSASLVIKYSTPATLARAQGETSTSCFAMSNDVYASYWRKVGNVPI